MACPFGVVSYNSLLNPKSHSFSPLYLFGNFILLKISCVSIHQQQTMKKRNFLKIPFTIASKRIKHLRINLTKEVIELYTKS